MSEPKTLSLQVGRTYRAKRPAAAGTLFNMLYNDRQILYMNELDGMVQYDSPSVRDGRKYPKVTKEQFLRWADKDVTDELPTNGDWAPWTR